jgi:hypothetical protein
MTVAQKGTMRHSRQLRGRSGEGASDNGPREKIELVAVTPESSNRDALLALVNILQKQGIKVTPAKEGSLLEPKD